LCWADQLSALGDASYRVVAPDQRGYSAGVRPADVADYAVSHLVADVLAVADEMGMDTFDLVGHDWGGYLAWVIAGRQPERTRTLTSVSTPHPRRWERRS
jgi:pimeloyl-ACP methyl ester carboxylesterase